MPDLPALNFPVYPFRLREREGKPEILDELRKKYVALTPEEWVRQHAVRYLQDHAGVPAGLIVLEKTLRINRMEKRADILAYTPDAVPLLLAECKAPQVPLRSHVLEQIARYNLAFRVSYLFITNGLNHFFFVVDIPAQKIKRLSYFPDWQCMLEGREL